MEPLIRVQNLMKIYNPGENEVRALDDVSLDIGRGEFVAIIGQSGSGKSTFMNMLGCLDVPTSGHYYLNGKDVSSLSDDELSEIRNQEIGFIFQGFNMDPKSDRIRKCGAAADLSECSGGRAEKAFRGILKTGRIRKTYGSQTYGNVRRAATKSCHSKSVSGGTAPDLSG